MLTIVHKYWVRADVREQSLRLIVTDEDLLTFLRILHGNHARNVSYTREDDSKSMRTCTDLSGGPP